MIFDLIPLLFWLLILVVVIAIVRQSTKSRPEQPSGQRDQMWLNYLTSFRGVVKTAKEKQLLEALIEGRSADELYSSTSTVTAAPIVAAEAPEQVQQPVPAYVATATTPTIQREPLNNTLLLLYFGAFLLVTSVGLFVALASFDGILRTIIVALTALALYGGGLWLYATNKKLRQAGISFMGSGLIIAPLTGVAWYNLVSDQTNGGAIWLATSIACLGLYLHALLTVKNSFVAYLLIGSFVSCIQSAVLTIELPAYGYAWGLAVAGLILAVVTRARSNSLEFNNSSEVSAQILTPLSIFGSITVLPAHGSGQLSISLLLAGIYYALLAYWNVGARRNYVLASQLSAISSLASATYALSNDSFTITAAVLSGIVGMYAAAIGALKREHIKAYSLDTVSVCVGAIALLMALGDAWTVVAAMIAYLVLATTLWTKQLQNGWLQLAGALLIALPFVVAQSALNNEDFGSNAQISLSSLSALILLGLTIAASQIERLKESYTSASLLYLTAITTLTVTTMARGFDALAIATTAVITIFVALRIIAKDSNWLAITTIFALTPAIYELFGDGVASTAFGISLFAALAWNIGVSFATRQALVRWVVVVSMMIAPFALSGGGFGFEWHETGYTFGFVAVMASCVLARAIARGKLLLSLKVPIDSYYTHASQAYTVGYTTAGFIAFCYSFSTPDPQIITSVVLTCIGVLIPIIAYIERNAHIGALLPLVLQSILFSVVRPDIDEPLAIGVTAIISTLLAAAAYTAAGLLRTKIEANALRSIQLTAVTTSYIGALLVITQDRDINALLPISLFVASMLTIMHNRSATQSVRESSLIGAIISAHWLLLLGDVDNVHIHTHLLALFLTGFALWRYLLHDKNNALNYGKTAFMVIAIPLALNSLFDSESYYGWLLLGELVLSMILGSLLSVRFLVKWGLWTAIAAVLFQLSGLGWAFVAALAVVIISVAVYQLQKHNDS